MNATLQSNQFAQLSNGIALHYMSAGSTTSHEKETTAKNRARVPLLLFLHGFPEAAFAWEAQLTFFGAHGFFAVAPDLRGFNLSSMPHEVEHYRTKHLVRDIELFVQHLGYESCVLVAHDWGGAVAWQFAMTHPAMVQQLIIINSPHPFAFARELSHNPAQQAASQYMNWLRAEGSENALAKDDFARLDAMLIAMQIESENEKTSNWYNATTRARYHAMWARGLRGGVNYYRASPLYPPTENDAGAKKLNLTPAQFPMHTPTHIIWGERDQALLPCLLEGIENLVPNVSVTRVPDASHWIAHEKPDWLNQEIVRVLPHSFISD